MKRNPSGGNLVVKLLLALGAVSSWAGQSLAEDFRIATFDGSRSYRPFASHSQYEDIRGADYLLNPAFFGPGGVVDRSIQFEPALSDARDTGPGSPLASVDMLIMTEVHPLDWDPDHPDNPATAAELAEYQAIAQFVRSGGCLVMTVDTLPLSLYGTKDLPNPWVNMANGVLGALDGQGASAPGAAGRVDALSLFGSGGPVEGSLLDYSAASRVLHGSFAYLNDGSVGGPNLQTEVLSQVRLGASEQYDLTAGSWSHVLAKRVPPNSTRDLAMEIPLNTVVAGAGAVLVAGDALFLDDYVHIGDAYALQNLNNARLLMNFIAQQAIAVPEPAALVLLASGAAATLGIALARLARPNEQARRDRRPAPFTF